MTGNELRSTIDEAIEQHPKINGMDGDINELKSDVKELKSDVKELKSEVKELKGDVAEIKNEQKRQGIVMEDLQRNLKVLAEGVVVQNQRWESFNAVAALVQGNKEQISVLNAAFTSHATDASLHKMDP